jgi:hypothetical protein
MVNTKQKDEIEFAAFMGIDWADQTHAWALELPTHCGVEHGDLAHTPEALEAWAAELAHRFGGQPIAVAVEHSRYAHQVRALRVVSSAPGHAGQLS